MLTKRADAHERRRPGRHRGRPTALLASNGAADEQPPEGARDRIAGPLGTYALGALLVRLADEGARVVLALLALQRTGGAAAGGALGAALLAPHVVAAPLVGLLGDRLRRPPRLVAVAALGLAASLIGTALLLGCAPLPVVLALLLAGGCCGPALTGVLSSQLPRLVPRHRLPRAFGVDSLTYNVAGIVGPAAGGLLAAATSPATAVVTLASSAAAGGTLVGALPVSTRRRPAPQARARDLLTGVSALGRDPVLRTVTAATCVGQLGAGALPVVAAVLAERRYGAAWAGGLLGAAAAAGLLGSLAWTWRPAPPELAPRVVLAGLVASGVPLAAAGAASSVPVLVALFALSGLFQGPLFGALLVTRDRHSRPDVRGQVFAIGAGAKITVTAAGAALGGALAGEPSGEQLLVAGAWPVLAGVAGLAVLRRSGAGQPPRPLTAARTTSGTGTGRRVAASTYTCTNRPSADGSSSPVRKTASR